jgi:hypothetical protein
MKRSVISLERWAPCQQFHICAEAHRGIVVKAPGVMRESGLS